MEPAPPPASPAHALHAQLVTAKVGAQPGTGGLVWGGTKAGLSLLDYLAAERAGGLAGARVLSLGCGLGALELVCAGLGAAVLATDLPAVRPLFAANAACNAALLAREAARGGGALRFEELDWCAAALPAAVRAAGPFDYVLASDCVYWPELFAPLAATMGALAAAQAPAPLHFFLLIEPRTPRELDFLAALQDAGFALSRLDERHSQLLAGAVSSCSAIFCAHKPCEGS